MKLFYPKRKADSISMSSSFFSMKKILLMALLMFGCHFLFSQNDMPPIFFQQMQRLAEIQNHVDIDYEIVRCNKADVNQVFIRLHNESNVDQNAVFKIEVINNENGESFIRSYSIQVAGMQMIETNCDSDYTLKIDLPKSFSPQKISLALVP